MALIFYINPLVSIAEEAEESTKVQFSEAELEQMLAPIALYPDSVLTHILIASTYPLEIIEANRWVTKNPNKEAAEALKAVENEEWDPSVKALVPFPRILERLSDDLKWTQKLGDAFLQDEARVLSSIQALRQRADQAGNLDKMENMVITREKKNIIIQPVETEVIYVPYYDTRVVYGTWHYVDYQPIYWDWSWHHNHHHHGYHHRPHYGMYSWYPAAHVTTHYYWSAFNWHNHHVIVVDHRSYNSRRYRHREHIIADNNSRRWTHNPTHRRGVAYRTNTVSERFNSTRPSVNETREIRNNERNAQSIRHTNSSRTNPARENTRVESASRLENNRNTNTRTNNERTTTNRENIELTTNARTEVSRQERLRQQLNNERTQTNLQPSVKERSSYDTRIINSNNSVRETRENIERNRTVNNNDNQRASQVVPQTKEVKSYQQPAAEQRSSEPQQRAKREPKPQVRENKRGDDNRKSSSNNRTRTNRSSQSKDK